MGDERQEVFLRCQLTDWIFLITVVLGMVGAAELRNRNVAIFSGLAADSSDSLGAEYNCIALSIRGGRGFADPFGVPSGPTAWMPPVLPYALAGLYWLGSGDADFVRSAVVFLYAFAVVLSGALVASEARRLRQVALGRLLFVAFLVANFSELFQTAFDGWIILTLVNCLWWVHARAQNVAHSAAWGIFGGFAALCSPVIGFTWAALITTEQLGASVLAGGKPQVNRLYLRRWLALAAVSLLVVLPWIVRTRVAVGAWFPIKSNVAFELWQSQIADDDGVLDWQTLHEHPWAAGWEQRNQYLRLGEAKFLAAKRREAMQSVLDGPSQFAWRVFRRSLVAWGFITAPRASPQPSWITLMGRLVAVLPILSAVFLLWASTKSDRGVRVAVGIYFLYLMPYILISYHSRYAVALLGTQMLLVLFAADRLRSRVAGPRP